jgi:hypothetical protein
VKRLGTVYDFILLSAVLMFLPNETRVPSLETLISLLRPGGRLAMTVRLGLGEPTRGLLALTEGELALLMLDCTGVIALNTSDSQDHWNRDKLTWKTVVLEKPARPSAIETTRAYGRKAIASENDERCPI